MKKLFLMSGLPGSGKSTWIREQMSGETGAAVISRDQVRFSMLSDTDDYFAHENEVYFAWISQIKEAMRNPELDTIYIDATHLTEHSRWKVLDDIEYLSTDWELTILIFDVPIEICIERNKNRTGREFVAEEVIQDMNKRFKKTTELGEYKIIKEVI